MSDGTKDLASLTEDAINSMADTVGDKVNKGLDKLNEGIDYALSRVFGEQAASASDTGLEQEAGPATPALQ